MTPSQETLREQFQAFVEAGMWQGEDEYTKNFPVGNIADWWLQRTISKEELLEFIEKSMTTEEDFGTNPPETRLLMKIVHNGALGGIKQFISSMSTK